MFRRPRFRPLRREIITNVPPALRQANAFLSEGKFLEAAVAFEKLAEGAQLRGIPQAAHLYLSAGRCRMELKQSEMALVNIKKGLTILSDQGRLFQLKNAAQRFMMDFVQRGDHQTASDLKLFVSTMLPAIDDIGNKEAAQTRKALPAVCPSCGGSLRSDEVDWIDQNSVECPWCGSTIVLG